MILTVCILFVSCDTAAGTQGDETRGSEIGAVGTETHTDSAGKINLSLFSNDADPLPMFQSENRYQFEEISLTSEGFPHSWFHKGYFNTEGQFCFPVSDGQQGYILSMEHDGGIAEVRPYTTILDTNEQWKEYTDSTYMMKDGSIYYTTYPSNYIEGTNHCMVHHVNADGQLIASAIVPGTNLNSRFVVLEDREEPLIVVSASDSTCVYDRTLNLIVEIPNTVHSSFQRAPDGMLYANAKWSGHYLRFDPDVQTLQEATDFFIPHNVNSRSNMYFSILPSSYDVYYADHKGFWGYCQGDAEAELLCSGQNPI